MKTYPFITFPEQLLDSKYININNLNPPEYPKYPQKPEKNGFWEHILGINNKIQKYEKEKNEFYIAEEKFKVNYENYELEKQRVIIETLKSNQLIVKKKYFEFFSLNKKIELIDFNNKRGVSENSFFNILKTSYGDDVITDKYYESLEYPDFLIIKKIDNLDIILNIEIDEPYTAETGEPIHYTYIDHENKNSYMDFIRDYGYNFYGIIVIRFAEEQVVNYPQNCIQFIDDVLDSIKNYKFPYFNVSLKELPEINRWSKKDAIKLSNLNHRNSYLNKISKSLSKRNGKVYHEDDFIGSWKIVHFTLIIKKEIEGEFDNKFISFYIKKENSKSFSGTVGVKKDLLILFHDKEEGKDLTYNKRFKRILQITKYNYEGFEFNEPNKEKTHIAIRII